MFKLENLFLENICFHAIQCSNTLKGEFDRYSSSGCFDIDLITHVKFNPDYNLQNKYYEMIVNSTNNFIKGKDLFKGYDELTELFEYVYHVYCFSKQQKIFLDKTYSPHPKMKYYIEESSRLTGIQIDKVNLTCTLNFNTVAAYDDLRMNKIYSVDTIDLDLIFKDVRSINLDGSLNFQSFISPNVYKVHCTKENENIYCYSLYGADGAEPIFLEILFSDLDIKIKEHVILPEFAEFEK